MRDGIEMPRGVGDRNSTLGVTSQSEPFQLTRSDDRLDVEDVSVQGEVSDAPLGESGPPFIEPGQGEVLSQAFKPLLERRELEVELEVTEPSRDPEERRSFPRSEEHTSELQSPY